MTGMYPARLRLTDFIAGQNRAFAKMKIPEWNKQLDPTHVTIAEALQSHGYRTVHIGKWHLNGKGDELGATGPKSQGFDTSISGPAGRRGYRLPNDALAKSGSSYLTDWLTDKACEFVGESRGEPFFLYFAYNVPHTPIQGRDDLVAYFKGKVDPDAVHKNPTYAAMVASLDQSVGRVLETIDDRGLDENTIVIFTSDNGGLTQRYGKHDGFTENLPLRRGKGSAYEGGVRVPAIVRWPDVTPEGSRCDTPVMTIDYYPTLLEISGVKGDRHHNASVDGQSLVPLLRDPNRGIDRELYWHYPHYHAGGDGPYSAVRNGNFRLIEFHEDSTTRLYDLSVDLGEQTDLSSKLSAKRDQLRNSLHRWRESVGAQMPTPNPDYDPARATVVLKNRRN
jgi:arylsulfatase A-like enzyme